VEVGEPDGAGDARQRGTRLGPHLGDEHAALACCVRDDGGDAAYVVVLELGRVLEEQQPESGRRWPVERRQSSSVGSRPASCARATHEVWACRRREASSSGAISTCSLIACNRFPQSGHVYVAGRLLWARRTAHHRACGGSVVLT